MNTVRRAIVVALETACEQVDRLWDWPPPVRWLAAMLGCPSGLAVWSARLDERWQTGVWTEPDR